jgi:hypothetical protein
MKNILEILLNSDLSKEDLKTVIDGFIAGESLKIVKTDRTPKYKKLVLGYKTINKLDKHPSYIKFAEMSDDQLVEAFKRFCKTKKNRFDRPESIPSYCKREMIRRKIISEDLT